MATTATAGTATNGAAAARSAAADVPVAIIGMAARAAGAADTVGLWSIVSSGQDMITEVPGDRLPGFDAERLGVPPPRAALLDRIDTFDAFFFGLSPRQAAFMDPRQRLLLEETWHAFEDAAIAPDTLAQSDTGVFVGSAGADFRLRCDGLGAIDQYTAAGTLDSFLANRISYQFDLRGCSVHVDTACSAGLTAVTQAAQALAVGQVDLAVAAGANVICHGFDQEAYLKAGVLSAGGRVRSFSDDSDGYIRGDGVAVVILKRLADAERDGDPIRAVIRGMAQCHDGRAGGQFSPDAGVQAELIRRAAARAGVTPAALGYVEAHATGTRLGDMAEATGLARALQGALAAAGPDGRLWVGGLKAAIGHTEGAAGLFGLIKAVLVLEHERIPALPGFTRLLRGLPVDQAPLAFPTESVAWPKMAGQRRLAGVSSFGLGGANVHVVISDPPTPALPPVSAGGSADHDGVGPGRRMFPLSAATGQALAALAGGFADWLGRSPEASLDAVAWTLQSGRAALAHRAVLTGLDAAAVASAAKALSRGAGNPTAPGQPGSDASATAEAFLAGRGVDWSVLWNAAPAQRRIALMSYPFEPHSHWLRAERPPAPLPPRQQATPRALAFPAETEQAERVERSGFVRLRPLESFGQPGEGTPLVVAPPAAAHMARAASPTAAPATHAAAPAVPAPAAAALDVPLENVIIDAAAEVLYLGAGAVGPDSDFVAAGLDSVLAVEFVQLLRSRTGLALTVEQVHQTRTARALAQALTGARGQPWPSEPLVPGKPGSREHPAAAVMAEPARPAPAHVVEQLRRLAGECLYLPPDEVDPDAEFTSIGLDSVLAVEYVAKVNAAFGASLTLTVLYEQLTINGLADALAGRPAPPGQDSQDSLRRRVTPWDEVFAVVRDRAALLLPAAELGRLNADLDLADLGVNSLDRMDIVTVSQDDLGISVPAEAFAGASNLRQLVDVLHAHCE